MVFFKKEKNYLIYFCLFAILAAFSIKAEAAKLQTTYLSAEIPKSWTCVSQQAFWICKDFPKNKKSNMITVITAKKNLPDETINKYKLNLKKPKTLTAQDGKLIKSKVYNSKETNINGHPWVQAMHFQSELKDYYTYYMFTKKDKLSISISMSVHKNSVKKINKDIGLFFNSIQLKNVVFKKDEKSTGSPFDMILGKNGSQGNNTLSTGSKKWSKKRLMSIGIIVLAVGLIGYAALKK